ncbi:MAG: hypothetical protein UW16_C0014G0020 [Microgenomates group bacterium GW2011_GWC1_44_10]|nr:MAG: hypothetical protein UW16_C0014G0020 [Microgenomates group bacterium GW2011_GWC1_44_10]
MERFLSFLGGVLCIMLAVAQVMLIIPLQVTTFWGLVTLCSLTLGAVVFGVGGVLLIISAFAN